MLKPHSHQYPQAFIYHNLYTSGKMVFKKLSQNVAQHGHPTIAAPPSWKQAMFPIKCHQHSVQDQLAGTVQRGVHGIHGRVELLCHLKRARPTCGRCAHPMEVRVRGSGCTYPASGPLVHGDYLRLLKHFHYVRGNGNMTDPISAGQKAWEEKQFSK